MKSYETGILRSDEGMDLSAWRDLAAAAESAPPWFAADNGFTSAIGMAATHAPIVAAVAGIAPQRPGVVVDLGCGNGALLAAICDRVPTLRPIGVERDANRLAHARLVLPGTIPRWHHSDLFTYAATWRAGARIDVTLLMLGRLIEVAPERAEALRRGLRDHAKFVLGYAYSDWIASYGDIHALGRLAGAVSISDIEPGIALIQF